MVEFSCGEDMEELVQKQLIQLLKNVPVVECDMTLVKVLLVALVAAAVTSLVSYSFSQG